MCGRFTLRLSPAELAEIFRLLREPELPLRYNIAPTQMVSVLRPEGGCFDLSLMQWGLIPSWAKDKQIGARLINARAETVADKPSFRNAFKRRRCLIPADGFYEWKKRNGKSKQPYFIGLRDDEPFAFAGLWERWTGPDEQVIESCTILTTEPNDLLVQLHDRMPVILHKEDYDRWLDPTAKDYEKLQSLLVPFPASEMRKYPIGTLVNSPKNDNPACVDPVDVAEPDGRLFD